ncbi:helix-turn-helix transcriptional regulator [Candidatus Nanohalobium constans]|uniref:helix-turn-helix transcriptional regulator n=1 Tax=Candidatus Nanohalobium constans TaxID=2565781 RepID=UPI001298438B|nr:hypothetical protein [Candidatus Nanohalobium constans]
MTVSLGAATTISQEDVAVDLRDNNVSVVMKVDTLTTTTFNYQTSHPVDDLRVKINGERVECSNTELAIGTNINCDTSVSENFTVNIDYTTSGLTTSQGDISVFRYSQSIYRPIKNYSFKVILPEGTGLVDQANATTSVVNPETGELGNMNGRRFFVEWNSQPELGEPVNYKVLYEPLQEKEKEDSSLIIPGSVLGLLLIVLISYMVYRRKNAVKTSNQLDELSEDCRLVVEMLQEEGGEMLQKDIVEESEYSKAKISGVVSTLVDEDIVSKEKEGRSNKVSLNNEFRD